MPEAAMSSAVEQQQRCAALEAELRETAARLNQVQEELNWKTAFLEAQVNSTLDGIIVVDPQGRKILQNQRALPTCSKSLGTSRTIPMTRCKSGGSRT
jgi:transcriptional regulator with PAS, ATPase and Fis domain